VINAAAEENGIRDGVEQEQKRGGSHSASQRSNQGHHQNHARIVTDIRDTIPELVACPQASIRDDAKTLQYPSRSVQDDEHLTVVLGVREEPLEAGRRLVEAAAAHRNVDEGVLRQTVHGIEEPVTSEAKMPEASRDGVLYASPTDQRGHQNPDEPRQINNCTSDDERPEVIPVSVPV